MLRILRYILFRQVGPERRQDVKGRLDRYLGYSNFIVSFSLFSVLLGIKLDFAGYVGPNAIDVESVVLGKVAEKLPGFLDGLQRLAFEKWFDLVFAGFVMLWFFAYRSAAANETELLASFYADDNPPKDWDKISGGAVVPLIAVGLTIAFLLLAWFIDNLLLFGAVMLFLLAQDAFGNNVVRRNILAHYFNRDFALRDDDPMTSRLKRRREIALGYWVWRPHLSRISLLMCGTALIVAGSMWEAAAKVPAADTIFRICLMGLIAGNEATMLWWRLLRDEALAAAELADEATV